MGVGHGAICACSAPDARREFVRPIDLAADPPYSRSSDDLWKDDALSEGARAVPAKPTGLARWWPQVLLVVLAVAWGATVSLTTIFMRSGVDPLLATFWSGVIGVVILSGYLVVKRLRPPFGPRYLLLYAICGFLGTALPSVLAFASAAHLSAGVRSVLFALIPMMTLALAAALGRETTGPQAAAGPRAGGCLRAGAAETRRYHSDARAIYLARRVGADRHLLCTREHRHRYVAPGRAQFLRGAVGHAARRLADDAAGAALARGAAIAAVRLRRLWPELPADGRCSTCSAMAATSC